MTHAIATITLNPAIDQTASIPNFTAGEVNRVVWEQSDPGGKGVNVASFLSDFGYSVAVSGFLGQENVEPFQTFFEQKGIADRFVRIPGRTRVNVKIVDEVQNQVTDINFPGQSPRPDDVGLLYRVMDELAIAHDWFVLSGSVPAGLTPDIYGELTQRLKAQGKTVVLDASGENLRQAIAAAPYAIKPNIDELQELVGRSLPTTASVVAAAHDLIDQGITTVVVSMGARGALFVSDTQTVWAHPPEVKVVSTVGAGDAMVAGFVTATLRGLPLFQTAQLATAFSVGALSQLGPRLPPTQTIEGLAADIRVEEVPP